MTYRLLCCSDTHGQPPPPLDESAATAWLHAGDVYDGWPSEPAEPRGLLADLPRPDLLPWGACAGVGAWLRRPIPVYAVRGNHDVTDLHGFFWKCDDVTAAARRVADRLVVAGVGWAGEQFSDLPTEADLRDACDVVAREAQRLARPGDLLVLLSHYPASFHASDRGSNSVHELVYDLAPAAVVAGHLHEWFGRYGPMDVLGGHTLAVHPGPAGGALDLDPATGAALWCPARVRKAG